MGVLGAGKLSVCHLIDLLSELILPRRIFCDNQLLTSTMAKLELLSTGTFDFDWTRGGSTAGRHVMGNCLQKILDVDTKLGAGELFPSRF